MNAVKTETALLWRIYGAIDRRVRAHPEIADQVSALLPAYEYPDVHWADAFPEWTEEFGADNDGTEGLSLLGDSLNRLGGMTLRCRLPARRIYALGAAGLAFRSELQGPTQNDELRAGFRNALTFPGVEGEEAAEPLLQVVLDDTLLESARPGTSLSIARWWSRLGKTVPAIDGVEGAEQLGPPPCSTGVVWVDLHGDDEPVATFTTEFDVAMPFDQALKFSDPENWACFALWCKMKYLGEAHRNGRDVKQYLETVSLKCDDDHTRVFEIKLDFVTTAGTVKDEQGHDRRVSVTEYRLSDDNTEGRVLVNEGSLVITELSANEVRIKTTKRLKFSDPLDGVGFASVLCHVGYMTYVEDLICCATAGDDWERAWPGWRPPAAGRQPTSPWVDPDFSGLTASTIRRTETALNKWLDDYQTAYKKSAKKSAKKGDKACYTVGDMLQDATEMWRVALCETLDLADYRPGNAPIAPGPPERAAARAARYSP